MADPVRQSLLNRWTHSHDEDRPGLMVFRPGDWDFPPARGRRSFELRADGSLVAAKPGPTDQTVTSEGKWRLAPGGILELERPDGSSRFDVVEVEADKLVVREMND